MNNANSVNNGYSADRANTDNLGETRQWSLGLCDDTVPPSWVRTAIKAVLTVLTALKMATVLTELTVIPWGELEGGS